MDPTTGPTEARLAPPPGELIGRYMALASALSAEYRGRRLEDDDLEGEALLALCEAARRFDIAEFPAESFRRFAERVIRSHLKAALERAPIVRRSRDAERASLRGDAAPHPAPHEVGVEQMGILPMPPADRGPLYAAVQQALDACSDVGRSLACYVHLDGLSLATAARRLGIGKARAASELALADRAIAGELRRGGWDEASWRSAIA